MTLKSEANASVMSLESNVRSYCRQFPGEFSRAIGEEVWTQRGKRYLDFLAGCGSLNYGHNNPLLKEALLEYVAADGITHGLDLSTSAKSDFLEAFQQHILVPRGLHYAVQFPGPTGANAVEAAFKLARKRTGRSTIVSFTNGFHGVTLGALAATGNRYHRGAAGITLAGGFVVPYDGYLGPNTDTSEQLERLIDDPSSGLDLPAAIVVEAVQGEGGLNSARVEWLQRLRAICDEYDILLILDEIQTGCGRTGAFFSFEAAGIKPDIVTMAKSVSGYGLPMALVLIRPIHDVWSPGEHNGTFRGNNHAFVTAAAAIKNYWQDDQFSTLIANRTDRLTEQLREVGERFRAQIVDVRGRGMMQGLRFRDPEDASRVASGAFDRGLIIERSGPRDEVVKLLAPLTISESHLDEGLELFTDSIQSLAAGQTAKGLASVH